MYKTLAISTLLPLSTDIFPLFSCLFIFSLYLFENLRSESLQNKCVHLQKRGTQGQNEGAKGENEEPKGRKEVR